MTMEQLAALWGPASPLFWVRAIWAITCFLIIAWIAVSARAGVRRAMLGARAPANALVLAERVTQLTIVGLGLVLALAILGVQLTALTALVGLAAIAFSLSVQDITRSLLAGLYLLVERPFQVGDTVEISGQGGIVQDVGIRATTLLAENGDRIIIPNLMLFTGTIVQKKISGPVSKLTPPSL